MAGALEGLRHGPQHGGLAGAGHAHHQFRPPSRGADAHDGRALLVRQPGTNSSLGPGDSGLNALRGGDGPVGAAQLAGQALGDGALPGQHRRQRVGPLAPPGHTDQGHDLGVGQGPVHQALEHLRLLPEELRGQGHDQVAAGEHLAPGQVALGAEHL